MTCGPILWRTALVNPRILTLERTASILTKPMAPFAKPSACKKALGFEAAQPPSRKRQRYW